ncbi:phosphopantetheine-binding protein [Nocardia sp. NPDC023852]|uniref:acyl carrier protein n=1 Tax=Nocardia sp. NPDC023852 TaxID=3154697 RepID=UPI0033F8677F
MPDSPTPRQGEAAAVPRRHPVGSSRQPKLGRARTCGDCTSSHRHRPGDRGAARRRTGGPTEWSDARIRARTRRSGARVPVCQGRRARPFKDLGSDSFGSVDLRNRLAEAAGMQLPASLVFDYPNAGAEVKFLRSRLEATSKHWRVTTSSPRSDRCSRRGRPLEMSSTRDEECLAERIRSILAEVLEDRESAARGDRVAVERASNADEPFVSSSTSKFQRSKE